MKTKAMFEKGRLLIIICSAFWITCLLSVKESRGQLTPVNFDGAPALTPGQLEASLFFGGSYLSWDGDVYVKGYLPGIKIGFGIAKGFDLKLTYSRGIYSYNFIGWSDWQDSKENNLTISPKVTLLKDIIAVQLPVTFILYKEYEDKMNVYYKFGPRFILSAHYRQYVEFNVSPFMDILVDSGNEPYYFAGGNLGFAFSSNLKRWSIRPEGYLSWPVFTKSESSKEMIYGWGIAATFNFDLFKKPAATK